MIDTKFIAADIQNLTDARYFAAWGAEWMSFLLKETDLNAEGLARIKEIIDWVDGPKMAASFPESTAAEIIMEYAISLGLDGIIISGEKADQIDSFGQNISVLFPCKSMDDLADCAYEHVIFQIENESQLGGLTDDLLESYTIYLDTNWTTDLIKKYNSLFDQSGLLLRGGAEEKVGFKSFDELDEIFDELEDS